MYVQDTGAQIYMKIKFTSSNSFSSMVLSVGRYSVTIPVKTIWGTASGDYSGYVSSYNSPQDISLYKIFEYFKKYANRDLPVTLEFIPA